MVEQNFSIVSGDTEPIAFSVRTRAGVPVDISTAVAAAWKLAETRYSEPLVEKTLGDGLSVATSVVTLTLAAADTATLNGLYYHEMQITDGSGHVKTRGGWVSIEGDLIP